MRQGGFAQSGQVFDQQMATGQEAGGREAQFVILAQDDAACCGKNGGKGRGGASRGVF